MDEDEPQVPIDLGCRSLRRALVALLVCLSVAAPAARSSPWWRGYMPATGSGNAMMTCFTADGNLVVAGDWTSTTGARELIAMKLDTSGNVLWSFRYGAPGDHAWKFMAPDLAGGVMVLGYINHGGADTDVELLGLSTTGDVEACRSVLHELPEGIEAMPGGDFVISGVSWVARIDPSANVEWAISHRTPSARRYIASADGGLVGIGVGLGRDGNYKQSMLWRDGSGRYLAGLLRDLGFGFGGGFNQAAQLSDGSIVVVDEVLTRIVPYSLCVTRTAPGGRLLWERYLPNAAGDDVKAVTSLAGDQIMIVTNGLWPADRPDQWLGTIIAMSAGGDLLWQRATVGRHVLYAVTTTPSRTEFAACGNTQIPGPQPLNVGIFDASGYIADPCAAMTDVSGLVIPSSGCPEPGIIPEDVPMVVTPIDIAITRNPISLTDACTTFPCVPLRCDFMGLDPGAAPGEAILRLAHGGGYGLVTVRWDLDGDGVADATGNPARVTLAPGLHAITATATDSCASPAPQTCTLTSTVDVEPIDTGLPPLAPSEVSNVLAGSPPLLVSRDGSIRFESVAGANAYHFYVDSIGSWYSPTTAEGTACDHRDFTSNGDGTVSVPFSPTRNSWLIVVAANACGEGPVGADSLGRDRALSGTWNWCGAAP